MFKIESYITPLLMGYVDKYVKLRPEDFQLSLWGGDAVLYNLDLRLDVIEKIFQLPIVFQSGHIHELRLHIPWTKLVYEPVVVTINTIECILKLRDTAYSDKHSSRAGSEARTKSASTPKQKLRKQDADDLPPGYLQSLMNKIINNVNIIVNNLIIKFVEDDIVLSLNVKSAECYSVDKDWNRGFVELTAPDFVLRRVINFCDLTVCLDKRDASGKIDHYQDPVMYRCSVSSRLYTKYEGMNAKYPLETKWNVFCERFDLSLTDTQLPMFLRIIELALAIYYGTLEFQKPATEEETPVKVSNDNEDISVGEPPPSETDESKQGWVSWAWSYVPQILPEEEDSGSQDSDSKPVKRKSIPSVFSIGMYAYKMSVIFKVTEFIKEKAHYGPKKISFKPFMYLESEGISLDILIQGLNFFDAQFGITNLRVFSQGVCICGADSEEHARNNVLLAGGESLATKSTNNYIYQSLFDPQSPENLGIPKQQILDFEEHKQIYTEQYGLQKYGVFWMDYLYSMPSQEEDKPISSRSSVSSMGEPSDVFEKENSLTRFVIGKCHLNVSSTTVHRVRKLLNAAYKYEYESYSKKQEERVDENRPHPTEEQVKSLLEYIPTRTYHVTLLQPVISVLSAEHPYCDIAKKVYKSQHSSKKTSGAEGTQLYPLFGMQMSSQRFDLQVTSPMYPRKLVQLVSKIAGAPSSLLHHCHSHTQIKLFGFHIGLTKLDVEGNRSPLHTIMPPSSGAMYIRRLLLPMYWNNMYLPKLEKVYELPQFSLSLTKGNLLVVTEIISSWQQSNPKAADINTTTLLEDVFQINEDGKKSEQPVLEMILYGMELKTCRNDVVTACSGNLSAIQALVYKNDGGTKVQTISVLNGPASTESLHTTDWIKQKPASIEDVTNELVTFTYQLPRKTDQIQAPAVVLINIEGICCNLDPVLIDWFSYTPGSKVVKSREPKVELDLELAKAASPLQGDISQMSQMSSGSKRPSLTLTHSPTPGQLSTQRMKRLESKDDKDHKDSIGEKLAKIFPLIRIVQVQVEMKKVALFLPKERTNPPDPSVNIIKDYVEMADSKCLCDTVVVCFPHVMAQSAGLKTVPFLQEIPITSMDGSLVGDKIPWTVTLRNCSLYTIHSSSLQPVKPLAFVKPTTVNCTVGVSYKYTPPTSDNISSLGLCLHTDMHAVEVDTSLEQIKLLPVVSSQSLKLSSKVFDMIKDISNSFVNKDIKQDEPVVPVTSTSQGQTQTLSATSVTEDQPYTHTSGDLTSLDTTPSRDMEILESDVEGVKLSLWLQWTLPKCEVNMYTKGKEGVKLSLILEDMTMSVDVQDVYSKVKVNSGTISLKHYIRSMEKWKKGPNEGILLTCRDELSRDTHIISSKLWSHDQHRPTTTQTGKSLFQHSQSRDLAHGCLNVTFTRALRKNVKKKFQKLNIEMPAVNENHGSIINRFYFHKYVSEICVSMNPCDVVLCTLPLIAILTDLASFDPAKPGKSVNINDPATKKGDNSGMAKGGDKSAVPRVTCSNHPLIYADFAAMRMFIPKQDVSRSIEQKSGLCSTVNHDMVLIQTQAVTITPHAENPLPRYAVDKELYQQAVQLGVTSESGSALQDRQYQLDVRGFSITTGCWGDFPKIESLSKKSAISPTTQIPAVEWNAVKSLMSDDKEIQLIPIISPADLKLVAAPAIVNTSPGWGNKVEEKLVCGYSLEFNIVSDVDLHLSTNQIHLMEKVAMEMTESFKEINGTADNVHEDKESVPDSGLGSDLSMVTEKVQKVNVTTRKQDLSTEKFTFLTPVDVLLTAGRISCNVYSHFVTDKDIKIERKHPENHHRSKHHGKTELEWRVDLGTGTERQVDDDGLRVGTTHLDFQDTYFMNMYDLQNQGQEVKVIPSGSVCIKPFLFLYISQPHTVLSFHEKDQKFETSCYDILAKGPQEGSVLQASDIKMLPDCSDFTSYFLETRAGQPDSITGVPPSLYTLTVTNFMSQPAGITLKLERPVRSSLSFVKLTQFEEFLEALFPAVKTEPVLQKSSVKPSKSGKPKTDFLGYIKRISFFTIHTEQIVVSLETKPCEESPGMLFSCSNVNFGGDVLLNTTGNVTDIHCNSYIRDVFVKVSLNNRQLPLIGPFSVKTEGSLSSFFLKDKFQMSQSIVTIATGLVPIHIGQEHVLCLKLFSEHFTELMKELSKTANPRSNRDTAEDIKETQERKTTTIIHTSADDLRSGAFQYVLESEEMTRPGEIAFCTRDSEGNSSMTWTYSMPRVISHISSTPIPFNIVGPDGDKMVQCVLQHWEPLIQQFVDYLEVDLSDSVSTDITLPNVKNSQSQDLVVAQTWRILIRNLHRKEVILPTSLAASMKIDSCFIPDLVPSYVVGCTLESVELHLSNHLHCLGKETPFKLRPFFMSSCYPASGEFAVFTLDNVLCAGSHIAGAQSKIQGQFNSTIKVDLLEYKTLTMQRVVSPFEVSGVALYQLSTKPAALDIDINCEPVTVRLGQAVTHTVFSSIQAWNHVLSGKKEGDEVIFGHYVICNDTQVAIRFGQVGTDENLILQPREMHQYGWRSHKLKQELHLCLDGKVWKWCEPFEIGKVGSFVRGVKSADHHYTVIIRVSKLSNVQNQIIISGQLVVSNRLSQHLEVKVVTNSSDQEHRAVVGSQHTIPSYILEPADIQGIKFRPWGSRGIWSKEVYVSGASSRENNLVKVTFSDQKSSFSIWCRVFSQRVDTALQIFVILCPLYTVRSHLPYTMYINIDTSKLDLHQQIEAPGRGHDLQLLCAGGDVHHSLTFQLSPTAGKSSSSVTLSTGLIDQLTRSPVQEVDYLSLQNYWKQETWFAWPYSMDLKLEENVQKPEKALTCQELKLASQPTIDLNVSLSEYWPGCPTVLVDITPACLVTNLCDLDLVIMGTEDISYDIPKGQTLSPPKLEGSFHVGLKMNDTTFFSAPVPLSEEELNAQRYRHDVGKTLYIDSHVNVPIFLKDKGTSKVCFLTLTSNVNHKMQVISIRERINLTNFTSYDLDVCPFAVPQLSGKIKSQVEDCFLFPTHRGCHGDKSDLQPLTLLPLVFTEDLKDDIDSNTEFVFYIKFQLFKTDNVDMPCNKDIVSSTAQLKSDWSVPVRISANQSGCKVTTCIDVTKKSGEQESVPLCITGHEKQGVMYFVIDVDQAPTCHITNRCQFQLYFGQTLMNLSLSGTTVQEETELVCELPVLQPDKATYYTPPHLNTIFPQVLDKQTIPKLHISAFPSNCDNTSNLSNLVWSQPIDLLMAADNFVTIPGVADVKVHVMQVAMVTYVTIHPITKADVSAKEIRSRLKGKDTMVVIDNKDNHSDISVVNEKPVNTHVENTDLDLIKSEETKTTKKPCQSIQFSMGFLVNQFSLIIQDELTQTMAHGELVRLTVDDLFVATYPASYLDNKLDYHRNCFVFSAGDVQLDNQNHQEGKYDFPVVIMRQNTDKAPYNSDNQPFAQMNILEKQAVLKSISVFHVQVLLGNVDSRKTVIESVEFSSKPLSFYIDDSFIFRCIKEAEGYLPVPLSNSQLVPVKLLKLPSSVKSIAKTLSNPIVIGYLALQPLDVLLSVHASLKLFIASDHTPLSFGKLEKKGVCTSGYFLTRAVVMHYASGALFRAGAVVGSLEILGNPTGLVRSIGTGVADFFRMPYRGLTRGPGAFVHGVSQGTSSMVKNITTGMLKSVTNFASSVSRNMDRLSLDGTHLERQEESRRHRPDGVGDGLIQGLTGLGISLLGAIAGLADQPIQSLVRTEPGSQSKTASLMTGMGKGLVGVFTKPIGGAAEFVSQTGQGILQGTGLSQYAQPRTPPVNMEVTELSCGQLKYALKLLPSLPSTDILCCMEANFIDLTDSLVPVTLILTPEILFLINHEEDSQQQSFSVIELECGVTVGDHPILNIVQRDSQTFNDQQLQVGLTNDERVTAFIDGASKFVAQQFGDGSNPTYFTEPVINKTLPHTGIDQFMELGTSGLANMSDVSSQRTPLVMDQAVQGRYTGSESKGEQLSDTQSDSSLSAIQTNFATLPQYDFYMSATKLAAFLALFNLTKHKLESVGFAV